MSVALPATFRKMVATKLTTNFREAVKITSVPMVQPGPNEVLMKTRYVGINATDINTTAGRYKGQGKPPFDIGMEGIGEIVQVGREVQTLRVGQAIGITGIQWGTFTEYKVIPEDAALPLPAVKPEFVSLLVSGITADISLSQLGELKAGDTVLITAAAGGTGQFAVQLAKLAGCHVIGTCSTDSKVELLKSIGCDRPINYKKENLKQVLKKEYPGGLDVVYETIGGEMFDTCLKAIADYGRIITLGYITDYEKEGPLKLSSRVQIPPTLLIRSASLKGFNIYHFQHHYPQSIARLCGLMAEGKLKVTCDLGKNDSRGPFRGLEGVYDAVEYLFSGRSEGKTLVEINSNIQSKL